MLFGVIRILAEEAAKAEKIEIERYEYGYGEGPVDIKDLLRSPMTLAEGAAIMNEYRRENGNLHD